MEDEKKEEIPVPELFTFLEGSRALVFPDDIQIKLCISTTDLREKISWGKGSWLSEPDVMYFVYKGIECSIIRNLQGCFCGYIYLPLDHEWAKKENPFDVDTDVHGGITFGEEEWGRFRIGFDCGHSDDYSPAMEATIKSLRDGNEELKATYEKTQKLKEEFESRYPNLFKKTYKDIYYVIEECKSLADQAIKIDQKLNKETPRWIQHPRRKNWRLDYPDFSISYQPFPHDTNTDETALILPSDRKITGEIFLILKGDWREEYEKLAPNGAEACKKFYEEHKKEHRCEYSEDEE